MFWKLFNYISGQNDKQVKIPMTAPVSVYIEPGSGPNCESTFTMAFYVPSDFQGETPQPSESDVSIEERQEFRVLARWLFLLFLHENPLNLMTGRSSRVVPTTVPATKRLLSNGHCNWPKKFNWIKKKALISIVIIRPITMMRMGSKSMKYGSPSSNPEF